MDPKGTEGKKLRMIFFSLSTHTKQLLLVTFCDPIAETGVSFQTQGRNGTERTDSENVYERWVQQIFDPVLVGRSWVSAKKWGSLAKL